ncbi:hypothetical protein SRB5_52360 [Streptomyces sp. RB5]|uniref:histidine kinase n=1 Tax=Streptomyces smaragdinus TaxID=2585196 RepID=A0A7K0CNN1_9ACTN|nr:nitrate- and nitrite sensing domain-containing protein [Streptomyces smaragdinus]MQY15059.1 hypothetical protein [Streptomyces smaragdinus]
MTSDRLPAAPRRRSPRLRSLQRILAGAVAAAMITIVVVATARELGRAESVRDYGTDLDRLAGPTLTLVSALQAERRTTAAYWNHRADELALHDQQDRTDLAAGVWHSAAASSADTQAVQTVLNGLAGVHSLRDRISGRDGDRDAVLTPYTAIIDRVISVPRALRPSDGDVAYGVGPLTGLLQAQEALAREDTLLAGAAHGSTLTAGERVRFAEAVGAARSSFAFNAADLPDESRTAYRSLTYSPAWGVLMHAEDLVLQAESAPDGTLVLPPEAVEWTEAYANLRAGLDGMTEDTMRALADRARDKASARRATAVWLAAGAGLLTFGAVALLVLLLGRLVRRTEEIRSSALDVTRRQLPPLILKLQRGEDADMSVLPPQTAENDEFGEIANVVAKLAEEVADAAKAVYEERFGFEKFAEGVTLRAVTLIVAILRSLDDLQDRYADTDSELLRELYELDHLTVRVRRQLENLLVLSGGAVANPHTEPVHVANLIVDAAGEARGFAQVTKEFRAEAWVAPDVAGQLTHLIAELIENATTYSPSGYEVTVRAADVPGGVAVEVEDQGRAPEHWYFQSLNSRLLDVPSYAVLAKSADQLGLFVVGQLAQRHGVQVSLREGRRGGVLASVLVPDALLTREPAGAAQYASLPPRKQPSRQRTQPHAAEILPETTPSGLARRLPTRTSQQHPATARTQEPPVRPAAARPPEPTPDPQAAAAVREALVRQAVAREIPRRATPPVRKPAAGKGSGPLLPQRVPGENLVTQLRKESAKNTPARDERPMDDRPLDDIESAFTGLQDALTAPATPAANPHDKDSER